ncbi:MAG: nucleotide exchange factor GrpE [Bacteroidales bacterium]|nr:nucleotide exchange factor GrpE [Bacteroidales bacterium]
MDKINNETMDNLNEDTTTAETNPNEDIKVTVNDSNSETNKLEEMGKKLEEINDKYLRLYSDFENFRKRTSKERVEMIQYASEETIKGLLTIVDDYERAIEDLNIQENVPQTSKEGILLVYNKLMNFLTQKGVKTINAKGEMFDENLHEAVSQFPAENGSQKGLVIEELLKGYTMFDKVIRFSKVVVAI